MELLNIRVLRDYLPTHPHPHLCPNPDGYPYYTDFDLNSDAESDTTMVDPVVPRSRKSRAKEPDDVTPQSVEATAFQTPKKQKETSSIQTNDNTPIRPSMHDAVVLDEGVCDPDVKAFIKLEFKERVIRDYPIVDFVTRVWKFPPSQIPDGKTYSLPKNLCNMYLTAGRYLKMKTEDGLIKLQTKCEAQACEAFQGLFRYTADMLMKWWDKADPKGTAKRRRQRFQGMFKFLQESIVAGNYASFKPDFGYLPADGDPEAIAWEALGFFSELKKRMKKQKGIEGDVVIDLNNLLPEKQKKPKKKLRSAKQTGPPTTASAPQPSEPVSTSNRKRSRPDSNIEAREPQSKKHRSHGSTSKQTNNEPPRQQGSKKLEDRSPGDGVPPNHPGLTNNEVQAAKYLNELLSHGARNYATGLLIEDEKITLWYGDRFGIVKATPFDFLKEPHYFLLAVAALCRASDTDLGFCPLLENVPPDHLSYTGAILRVPSAIDALNYQLDDLVFKLNTSTIKDIKTNYGTVGRGTTVIPVAASGLSLELFGPDDLVVKLSWQPVKRREEKYIRRIRKRIACHEDATNREALKYIVEIKCSASFSIDDPRVHLPRAFMEHLPAMAEKDVRKFRILVMKEYLPLQLLDTADELKIVFRNALTGHRWAWEVGKILHRDISISNIMFYRTAEGVVGVLCDWDLSATKRHIGPEKPLVLDQKEFQIMEDTVDKGDIQEDLASGPMVGSGNTSTAVEHRSEDKDTGKHKARYRTGTGPFMALDLLAPGYTPAHLYRFDLESFFWVLVYFVATHNPDRHTLGRIDQWAESNLSLVRDSKRRFLMQMTEMSRVLSKMHAHYKVLQKTVVWPLHRLFMNLENTGLPLQGLRVNYMAAKAERDSGMEEEYGQQIVRISEERNQMITFEKIMNLLS